MILVKRNEVLESGKVTYLEINTEEKPKENQNNSYELGRKLQHHFYSKKGYLATKTGEIRPDGKVKRLTREYLEI